MKNLTIVFFISLAIFARVSFAGQFVKIAMYGDSTTYGAQTIGGTLKQTSLNEPSILQASLRSRLGDVVSVDNQGVGGTEASQLLNGTDGVHLPFAQEMAKSDADIVVINFALNDSYYYARPMAGVISESPTDYWGAMASLCYLAHVYGKICVYEEPNPVYGVGIGSTDSVSIYSYVYVERLVAQQMNAPIIPQFDSFQTLPNWLSWLSEDLTHPTDAGYAFKAANTEKVLLPIVQSLLHN